MSSLAIIVIIVLLAAFIYMWAKCQSLQKATLYFVGMRRLERPTPTSRT